MPAIHIRRNGVFFGSEALRPPPATRVGWSQEQRPAVRPDAGLRVFAHSIEVQLNRRLSGYTCRYPGPIDIGGRQLVPPFKIAAVREALRAGGFSFEENPRGIVSRAGGFQVAFSFADARHVRMMELE